MDGTGVQRCEWLPSNQRLLFFGFFRWTSFKALLLEKPSAKQVPTPILFPKLNCMSLVLPVLFCSVFSMPAPLSRSWHLDTRLVDPCWSFDPSTVAQLHLRYRGSWIVWVTALQHQGLAMSTAYFQRFATAEASRHVCMMYRNHRLRVGGLRCRWPIGFLGKAKIHTKRF